MNAKTQPPKQAEPWDDGDVIAVEPSPPETAPRALAKPAAPLPAEPTRLPVRFDAESLIAKAIEHNLPVETMERLLAMRAQLKAEAAREAFFRDLSGFQGEVPVIRKSRSVKNRDGKSIRYRYASLEDIVQQVNPLLQKWGFSYTVRSRVEAGPPREMIAETHLHHRGGHTEISEFRVPIGEGGRMNASQEMGSASTYAKRYSFCNATGILTSDDDDDGNSAPEPERRPLQSTTTAAPKPAPTSAKITPEHHRRMEARCNELHLDREWARDWFASRLDGEWRHLNDVPDALWAELDARMERWAAVEAIIRKYEFSRERALEWVRKATHGSIAHLADLTDAMADKLADKLAAQAAATPAPAPAKSAPPAAAPKPAEVDYDDDVPF